MCPAAAAAQASFTDLQAQLYGASHALFHKELTRLGMELTIIDTSDPESWEAALRPNTKARWLA